jgi:biopolymer transport protein ExbB
MRQRTSVKTMTLLMGLGFLAASLFVWQGSASRPGAYAQEIEVVEEPLGEAEPDAAVGEVNGEQPGTETPEGEASSETETTEEEPQKKEMSVLAWTWKALGPMYMLVFLGLSFTLVALFVMNLLTARRENVCPMMLVDGFEAHLNAEEYQQAYDLARNDESFLGQVLSAGLAKLSAGYSQAIEAMQEVGEEENMKLEHRLSYMALIGTISPMVGLFGTVHGMIRSFSVIASGQTTPKASRLAEGISTALFTTLVGLAIAIPAIAAYNILRNRIARLVLEVGIVSEGLMRAAMENARKK